ncbi:hypothetical protein [Kiloniella antarctica]|uniref:SGNH hydrolase-type esterase domain-containing protein n=1 Tax=Kiloniella antarctica TaxID=1550907 RepID=A0ABW5BL32_9PROT
MISQLISLYTEKFIRAGKVSKTLYRFDAVIGFWGAPNIERNLLLPEYSPDEKVVKHNDDGNRDIPFQLKGGEQSVVCIGGSHTWGGGVNAEQRYSDILREKTGRNVVNLGHASLGIDQVCLAILEKSKKFNPRVIVIEQYPWAVIRILNNYVNGYLKPVFSLDQSGSLKLKKVPNYARFKLFRQMLGSFYSYKKELNEFRGGIEIVNNYDPMTDPIFLYWKCGHYDYLYALLEKILIVIRDHCLQNNIQLIFALGAIYQQFQKASPSDLVDYDLPRKRLMAILDEIGVAYVDMTDPMLNEHSDESPVIFKDGHINEKGNKVFAEILQGKMKERGWL